MKSSKSAAHKKPKPMDYTNYAYNEAVSRLKLMLAESYAPPSRGGGAGSAAGGNGASGAYMRHVNEDSTDNYSDNLSVIERPVYSDISKYLSPAQKSRLSPGVRSKQKPFNAFSSSKENLTLQMPYAASTTTATAPLDYYASNKTQPQAVTDSVHAPVEIFNFIEKQEDYIEQLEKESKYCRNELTNLLGKVKDVINENTHLTETARSELATLGGVDKTLPATSPSSDSDEQQHYKKKTSTTPRSKKETSSAAVKSPRYASAPNIVYEARISELEAELMQANIDLKRLKTENEELKRKLAHVDPLVLAGAHTHAPASSSSTNNCDAHRKQIEHLQVEKNALEESVRQLRKLLDDAKSEQYTSSTSSKRYINDLVQMERAQAELEVKHLREELDRQHERVRELQHEMARRIADERATAERRYNTQVDQLGGDLSSQWEQVAKLQLDLEREKRYANDMKRDLSNRNAQIDELKMELRSNRNTFLADMAQVNAEKQSLEQEITALRLQLDRAAREAKTEATRLTAEITSLRQRLDRGDADLLHSKREILRLNDEIANLEKELAYGEMKNEIRPTKKDLDKRISEMQDKHGETFVETVNELEDMIQSQKQLMDKLTSECKTLTSKLEDTTLKHKTEISTLQLNVEYLTNRMLNSERLGKLDSNPISYGNLPSAKATLDYKPSTFDTADATRPITDDYAKSSPYNYESILGKSGSSDIYGSSTANTTNSVNAAPVTTTASSLYNKPTTNDSSDALNDYKSSYNSKYGLNDPDDENIKDNLGEGEKRRTSNELIGSSTAMPSTVDTTKSDYDYTKEYDKDYTKDYIKDYDKDYTKDYTAGEINTTTAGADISGSGTDPNLAAPNTSASNDYNTDYSGYEGYGQQQYDGSGYDVSGYDQSAYDGSQQQYGSAGQYDTTGQSGYDTSGGQAGYGDYTAADYDQSAYQYDGTATLGAGEEIATTSATPSKTIGGIDTTPNPPTTAPASQTAAPSNSSTTATPAGGVAASIAGRSATESRNQPRTGSGAVGSGSTGSSGPVGGGKSNLSQQPAASATKK
ncbi:serologically defined colon cancer antigen 8 homolog isoform X2 [Bactrocera tryoni]|uniref:serologically defined colon cancer antigen 8 homolog isoform X2 n=1 Tax=Bactrocera tryoni TaxID=59916 RepID=UPI001A96601D|nr:serologically defined colon cancer antigen 8 homolog isoform X2 [Bactrocera tryoni]